jgi:3-oxoacyl-(acyl-carrier-protein) synthase
MTTSQKRRVVVTGLGVVAPNGVGLDRFETALREGRSGIRAHEMMKDRGFACQVAGVPEGVDELRKSYFSEEELVAMNSGMTFAGMAAVDAFRDAGLPLPKWDQDILHEDTGAIVGTGIGGLETFADKVYPAIQTAKIRRLGSSMVEQIMASSVSAKLSGLLALGNQVTTNSSACSTGTEALIMGAHRIQTGLANRMVVGGTEGASHYIWAGFDAMKVLSSKFNDRPDQASRPLSASACGFVPASGAGILVLEDLETALQRGARIYAEVLGSSLNSGGMRFGGSMTAPSGYSVQRAIRSAIISAGVRPDQINYVNGHLTATMADPKEIGNWSAALELPAERFPYINSTKSMIGHALGAAGGIECVATVLQLARGFVHPSLNSEDFHEELKPFERAVPRRALSVDLDIAAKASFGFGDVNSCVIFKKWREHHV